MLMMITITRVYANGGSSYGTGDIGDNSNSGSRASSVGTLPINILTESGVNSLAGNTGRSVIGGGGGGILNTGFSGNLLNADILTKHTVETQPIVVENEIRQPSIIDVDGGDVPIEIHFRSTPSRLNVRQSYQRSAISSVEKTNSEDEPTRLLHSVVKPVIQEVREIITPYRKVIQEIQPVQEEIVTIVAKGVPMGPGLGVTGASAGRISGGGDGGTRNLFNFRNLNLADRSNIGGGGGGGRY